MTEFKSIMPVLRVADMNAAVDWYTRIVGFEQVWRSDADGGGENCMLEAGSTNLMLSTGNHLGGAPAMTGTLYFSVRGVEELFERVKDRVQIAWPLEIQDYGTREFGVKDADGYVLAFAEDVVE